jgi:hypothetical protein
VDSVALAVQSMGRVITDTSYLTHTHRNAAHGDGSHPVTDHPVHSSPSSSSSVSVVNPQPFHPTRHRRKMSTAEQEVFLPDGMVDFNYSASPRRVALTGDALLAAKKPVVPLSSKKKDLYLSDTDTDDLHDKMVAADAKNPVSQSNRLKSVGPSAHIGRIFGGHHSRAEDKASDGARGGRSHDLVLSEGPLCGWSDSDDEIWLSRGLRSPIFYPRAHSPVTNSVSTKRRKGKSARESDSDEEE